MKRSGRVGFGVAGLVAVVLALFLSPATVCACSPPDKSEDRPMTLISVSVDGGAPTTPTVYAGFAVRVRATGPDSAVLSAFDRNTSESFTMGYGR